MQGQLEHTDPWVAAQKRRCTLHVVRCGWGRWQTAAMLSSPRGHGLKALPINIAQHTAPRVALHHNVNIFQIPGAFSASSTNVPPIVLLWAPPFPIRHTQCTKPPPPSTTHAPDEEKEQRPAHPHTQQPHYQAALFSTTARLNLFLPI